MILENDHPIERIMDNALIKIRSFVDADTVVGTPVTTNDGMSIIPISRVSMGFLTGGGEYSDLSAEQKSEFPFAGGSGAGVSVQPIGFLVSDGKSIKLVNINEKNPLEKLMDITPDIVDAIVGKVKK
ncbi:MAG: GerW family sporulation protein [Clostridiales bacterium]|nr:GerW family sporulation protein [Clostridiales bacterium]